MRKIKEVLRLKFEAKLSHERIAAATGVSKGAVTNYVQRALPEGPGLAVAARSWTRAQLEALLFRKAAPREHYAQPDFPYVHQELKRKGVTLQLLWEEYHGAHGSGRTGTASSACTTTASAAALARSMRQVHRAGEKLFIDYSGDTVAVIDAETGEIRAARDLRRRDGGLANTPMRRPPGRRACRTGSPRTSACLNSLGRYRICWCRTI